MQTNKAIKSPLFYFVFPLFTSYRRFIILQRVLYECIYLITISYVLIIYYIAYVLHSVTVMDYKLMLIAYLY